MGHKGTIVIFFLTLKFFLLIYEPKSVDSKGQYVMPLSGGMKMSMSYDIANLFIRPIGSTVSVALSLGLLCILFFGVITAPFGYMFGIPSRKYVLGTTTAAPSSRSLPLDFESFTNTSSETSFSPPTFEDQVFHLLPPDVQTEDCKLLALCHAHNSIRKLPSLCIKIIRLMSEKLIQLSPAHKEAIKIGLRHQQDCTETYDKCKDSGYSILIKTALYLLPESMKNHSHRRKKAMYM